jgi:hypothetical protein
MDCDGQPRTAKAEDQTRVAVPNVRCEADRDELPSVRPESRRIAMMAHEEEMPRSPGEWLVRHLVDELGVAEDDAILC